LALLHTAKTRQGNDKRETKKNEEEQNFNKKKMTALVMSCFTVGFVGLSLAFASLFVKKNLGHGLFEPNNLCYFHP